MEGFTANRKRLLAIKCSVLFLLLLRALIWSPRMQAEGPALTTISDTVYRADGTAASGTVLISWPSFQTAEGDVVAAGNQSVTIGEGGTFTTQLAPNAGASPAGTYYVVVFQLDDGTVRTEYWAVPATSPTTISAVRTTPGTGLANMAATQQYVNGAVANRALDSAVVHLAGTETVTGIKQFAMPPSLPQPVGANDAASKGYVDAAVQNVGSGQYVAKAGDTMTGPLTLPGDPTAPNQAADRHYVDSGLTAKADLVNGMVPPGELGTGPASSATCLTGNSTWGSCGGGAPAGITYATTALNWSQTIASALTGGTQATVTLTPCPVGVDTTSGSGYWVYISGGGNSEAVSVVSGSCTSGAASGTITFTPYYSYAAGYSIGSASSGIQETINAACGTDPTPWKNANCNVTIPANGPGYPNPAFNTYNVYGSIVFHTNHSVLSGYGVALNCLGRGPCLRIDNQRNVNQNAGNTIKGLSFSSPTNFSSNPAYSGVPITATVASSGAATLTTGTTPHGFRAGDLVTILYTDETGYWGDHVVTSVPSSTSFTYSLASSSASNSATAGIAALAYVAILDDGQSTNFVDINAGGGSGAFNNFFDIWDDENAAIGHFNNNGASLNNNQYWNGSFVFSTQGAPVINVRDSTITANSSSGISVWNSNFVNVENTVIQATGPWQANISNTRGNYQGGYFKNIYPETSLAANPVTPVKSPWPGTGVGGYIAGISTAAARHEVHGSGGFGGAPGYCGGGAGYPTCPSGSPTTITYYIVAHDTTANTGTAALPAFGWKTNGNESVTFYWPRLANGKDSITYDVISAPGSVGVGISCPGGTTASACGAAVTGLTQTLACGQSLVCSYTDNTANARAPYSIPGGNWQGPVWFWPGALVTANTSFLLDYDYANVVGVGLNFSSYVFPAAIVSYCRNYGTTSTAARITCLGTAGPNAGNGQAAMLLGDGDNTVGGFNQVKGRLNFLDFPGATIQPHHIITLVDSQPAVTMSTGGYRPLAGASDTYIGLDNPGTTVSNAQLAIGAPKYIDFYIGNVGDNSSFLERLGSTQKLFNVPVQFNGSVTLSGLANGCLNVAAGVIGSTGSPCGSGGGGGVASVFGRTGAVTAQAGDYTVSQVTGAAADAAAVHNTGNETIAGTKTFANNVTISGNLVLPQGSGYVPSAGGIGLDTTAGLPVVNLGGATHQVAFTSSNISGQAGTALALAQTPTQCSGSFATGIQANGNANCTTPNVIKLAETAQPAGIPNWGVFWFDAATHTPRVIENNGQVTQLGMTNLFNSDPGGDPADNLEEQNGTTAQNLRVYSNYVNNTTWTRMSLGSEMIGSTNYNVLRSEDATSGNAPSLGMHIGSGIKWFFSSDGTLKPNSDNSYDAGTDTGQAMRSVFAKTSFNLYTQGRQDFEFTDGGTAANMLAVYNSGGTGVQTASTSSTDGVVGIVSGYSSGTPAKAILTWAGFVGCNFDAASPVAGNYVVASTTQAGKCHDTGSNTRPSGVQVIGRIESGGVRVSLAAPSGGGGGGAVSSVFARTGAVTAQTGDYSVAQITGAAADGAVVHLAGAETIAGAKTFSSDVTLNGNLNVAGNINQTSSTPTQWSGKEWTGPTVSVPSGMDFSLGVGSDNTFKCQLASGASCMPALSGAAGGDLSGSYPNPIVVRVNGASVPVSKMIVGTNASGQIVDASSATLSNNTTGTAANLSGTPALPNGATATTQSAGDNSTKLATTAYVDRALSATWVPVPYSSGGSFTFSTSTNKAAVFAITLPYSLTTSKVVYRVGTNDNTANNYAMGLYNASGALVLHYAAAGTSFAPTANTVTSQSWVEGSTTLAPGKYFMLWTSSCTASCATLNAENAAFVTSYSNTAFSVAAGGTAPANITTGAGYESFAATAPAIIVE